MPHVCEVFTDFSQLCSRADPLTVTSMPLSFSFVNELFVPIAHKIVIVSHCFILGLKAVPHKAVGEQ